MGRASGLSEKETECLYALGIIHAHAGEYTRTSALLQQSIELAREQNDPYRQGLALFELARTLGSIWVQAGRPSPDTTHTQALTALAEASEIFQTLGAAHDLTQAQRLLYQIQREG